jgi:hypothetical protein
MAFPDTHRPQPAANTGSEPTPPGGTTKAADSRTQNPRQRGPNDPTGDPDQDLNRTIDDPKPPRGS